MRRDTLDRLAAARREGRPMVRALDLATGEEKLIDPASDTSLLGLAAAQSLARDSSGTVTADGRAWFLTLYNAPLEVVIVGAVHIGQALAQLAAAAGYAVRIIDPRPAYAADARFPGVPLEKQWPDEALKERPLTARSALVALAHDPKIDDPGLIAALRSPAYYVGALGSKRTHARRLDRLKKAGIGEEDRARIRGPVGLSIGARSPVEIAISILAELVQMRHAARMDNREAGRVAGVVLAAGLSSRMGKNKMVMDVNNKPLVRHAVDAALEGGLDPILVVTGNGKDEVEKALAGLPVTFVHNPDFARGLSTSLNRGIASLPSDVDGAMVLLGDMPGVNAALVVQVKAGFDPAKGRGICVATTGGMRGHPVLWARRFFPEIAALTGDQGAKSVLSAHADQVCEIPTPGTAPLMDIDTPSDLAHLAGLAGRL